MNPNLMNQVARDRRADLLREAEEYRRAALTARPTVLIRISARIPRFHTGSRPRRRRVVAPSTPGRMPQASEDPPPERALVPLPSTRHSTLPGSLVLSRVRRWPIKSSTAVTTANASR